MKQEAHWGLGWQPTLNQTGELKACFCSTSRWESSSRKASRDALLAKYPPSSPQRTTVSTTRPINWRTEVSRSEVPGLPWKYLLATILVAVCDQPLGTSTFSCLKIVAPFSLPMRAVRFSHSTLSKGETLPSVKYRSNTRPWACPAVSTDFAASSELPFNACFTVAILIPPRNGFPTCERGTLIFYSPGEQGATFPPENATKFVVRMEDVPPKSSKKTNALPNAGEVHTAEQQTPRLPYDNPEQVLRARFLR